jgi:uncharacterized peroxidase-related enzyme
MSKFTIHTTETAGDSKGMLESVQKGYGFIPNLTAVMAESPAMLEGYRTLAGIFDKSKLSEAERQIILMTNNRLNGCEYCMAAHTTISQMKRVPEDVIASLRENRPIADAKLEALRVFAEKVNLTRGWPTEADIETFLAAGYTKETILEVILGTSLKVLSNYTNHVAETPVDDAFAKNAWSGEAVAS